MSTKSKRNDKIRIETSKIDNSNSTRKWIERQFNFSVSIEKFSVVFSVTRFVFNQSKATEEKKEKMHSSFVRWSTRREEAIDPFRSLKISSVTKTIELKFTFFSVFVHLSTIASCCFYETKLILSVKRLNKCGGGDKEKKNEKTTNEFETDNIICWFLPKPICCHH